MRAQGSRTIEEVWSHHLEDRDGLERYSKAMQSLATGPWAEQGAGRISWCVDACEEYFVGGALTKLLQKDLRRRGHDMPTLVPLELLPSSDSDVTRIADTFLQRKWKLLDIGSCYNPFNKFDRFTVTAVDIAPADPSVVLCDFLNVTISDDKRKTQVVGDHLDYIKAASYDIAVFSLLLSYLPSTEQRLKCCINAHKALCLHGLLLIITPDSSHQNRHAGMMKAWKQCIESIGFHRWRYVKDTHLHCMAFRKTRVSVDYDVSLSTHHLLYIPQDNNEESDTCILEDLQTTSQQQTADNAGSVCSTQFDVELPFHDNNDYDKD